ncbi:MAG: hypothetical protein JWM59_3940 [Verrucomicrobiales bacterium]|nr:hypothetical protein [Verrucomicrobiales bacterium]
MKSLLTLLLTLTLGSASASPNADTKAAWPQWMGPDRDGVWEEKDLASRIDLNSARMVWAAPVGGGYTGPAVTEDRVYLLSFHRDDSVTDTSKGVAGEERLLCADAATGKTVWEQKWRAAYTFDYSSGPRATPTVHEGLVYALGGEGALLCASAVDGKTVWKRDLKADFKSPTATWGFAGHPLVHGDTLFCLAGGDGTTCLALDRLTGTEKWRALSSRQAGYAPPKIIRHHGREVLILWHGEAVNALDPVTGKVLWSIPKETRFGVSMASPIQRGDDLLITCFWWGSKMLRLKPDFSTPDTLWETERESDRRTEHLNALMCTPLEVDGYFYGVCSYGQLRCLEWKTGARKWETFAGTGGKEERWATAFLTRLGHSGNEFILFNEQGELIRAALTPEAYQEKQRRQIIEPNCPDVKERPVVWSHPAYARGHVWARNHGSLRCWKIVRD